MQSPAMGPYLCTLILLSMLVKNTLTLALMGIMLYGCSTEVDLIGDYQDRAIVYALLDQSDNPANGGQGHIFRVQKMFLGRASAFDMAAVPDSNYFKVSELRVNLVEFTGNNIQRFPMDTMTIGNKETGDPDDNEIDFFGPEQMVYVSERNLDPTKDYGVEVIRIDHNTQDTVYRADAEASLVRAPNQFITNPAMGNNLNAKPLELFTTTNNTFRDFTVRMNSAANARMYEIWVRFHYREVVNGVETPKSLDWLIASVDNPAAAAGSVIQRVINGESFYNFIGSSLQRNSSITRLIGIPHELPAQESTTRDVDIIVKMGGEMLYQYIQANSASNTGAIQDRPVFTNVNNGLGLFSSRHTVVFEPGMFLRGQSKQQLINGQYTSGLNFVDEDN